MKSTMWFVREDRDNDGNVTDRVPFPGVGLPVSSGNATFREITEQEAIRLDKARAAQKPTGYQPMTIEEKERRLNEDTAVAVATLKPITEELDLAKQAPPVDDGEPGNLELLREIAALKRQLKAVTPAPEPEPDRLGDSPVVPRPTERPIKRQRFGVQHDFANKTELLDYADKYYPDLGLTMDMTKYSIVDALTEAQEVEFVAREAVTVEV